MLARRREQLGVILGLLALNAGLLGELQRLWGSYRARTQWVYSRPAPRAAATLAGSPSRMIEGQSWAEIPDHNLFNPQRSSPHPEEKQAQAPELPLLFGTMNLGEGWFALMAPGGQPSSASKRVLPGEEIGGYKLVSIAVSQVVVEWQEKKFTIDVSESARRVPRVVERTVSTGGSTAPPAVESSGAAASAGKVTSVGSASPSASAPNPFASDTPRAKFNPAGLNAPQGAPADAPAGTVIDGKRKVVNKTPFGDQVWWVDVEPGQSSAGQAPEKKVQ